jgi:indolepyruvate ferredoxin oxidoreductase
VPVDALVNRVSGTLPAGRVIAVPAARLAERVLGDSIFTNLILLGIAWQAGRLPLQRESLERAIELNGAAVAKNIEAFRMGCHLYQQPALASRLLSEALRPSQPLDFDATVEDRSARLKAYWNAKYGSRYELLMRSVSEKWPEAIRITMAQQLYRVMAYKDEYEVARLLTAPAFRQELESGFGKSVRISFNLAPPAFGAGAAVKKRRYGSWMHGALFMLARCTALRETAFDPFGWSAERKRERAWRDRYMRFVASMAATQGAEYLSVLSEIARLPDQVRGFGHVKLEAMSHASQRWDELEQLLQQPLVPDHAPERKSQEALA